MLWIMTGPSAQSTSIPSWRFVDTWRVPEATPPTWNALSAWISTYTSFIASERNELCELRTAWDQALEELGGDPSASDWTTFAPLRREREEDWSDWLGQLLGDSRTGNFAARLFGRFDPRPAVSFARPRVGREVAVDGRRADLVIDWCDGSYTHVEVKVGDRHLEKTKDTALKLARAKGSARRQDVLLVLPWQTAAWDAQEAALREGIHLVTWHDVAIALRASLIDRSAAEPIRWRVWAHALTGAVEQELLDFPPGAERDAWCKSVPSPMVETVVDVLRVAWHPRTHQ